MVHYEQTAAPDLVVFTVIVDDLVFPDGTTKMAVMGGGGPQTAFGLRCHPADLSVGLAAGRASHSFPDCLRIVYRCTRAALPAALPSRQPLRGPRRG